MAVAYFYAHAAQGFLERRRAAPVTWSAPQEGLPRRWHFVLQHFRMAADIREI